MYWAELGGKAVVVHCLPPVTGIHDIFIEKRLSKNIPIIGRGIFSANTGLQVCTSQAISADRTSFRHGYYALLNRQGRVFTVLKMPVCQFLIS